MDSSELLTAKLLEDDNGDGMFGSGYGWLIWIVLIFLFFISFSRNISDVSRASEQAALAQSVYTTSCQTQREVLDSRYQMSLHLSQNAAAAAACCCETQKEILINRNEIAAEAAATRNLIIQQGLEQQNMNLRDILAQRDRELLASELVTGNVLQTQNIINALRPSAVPAYITCSPYTSNVCGCSGTCGTV